MTKDYLDFAEWLDIVLAPELPEGIAAFCFNLYEDAEDAHLFAFQLIGAPGYDPLLPDWACEELYSTGEYLFLRRSLTWESCLEEGAALVRSYLELGLYRAKLLAAKAVAIGFVDGDLLTIREA
ncbi:MAG: hypothetical protein IJJ43_03700 [Oscillospiraceae bacterium]|nr:hypothetical protein [Oscillospiraceae bacterium]